MTTYIVNEHSIKFSYFTSKALFVLQKSNFRILDIQISQCHQLKTRMSKLKARNTFYWIMWEVITVCQWNLAILCHITKEKRLSKIALTAIWKLVPDPFVFAKN